MKSFLVRLSAALLALGLGAACGGGSKTDDSAAKAEAVQHGKVAGTADSRFTAAADGLCVDRANSVGEVARWAPVDQAEGLSQAQSVIQIHERFVGGLRQLDPGSERQADFEEYIEIREMLIGALEDERDALDGDFVDDAVVQEHREESTRHEEGSEALAREMGLKACGSVLSSQDEAEVTAVVEKLFVDPEPSDCVDLRSGEAIERIYQGDLSACETSILDVVSDSLKITEIGGVGDLAWAEYTLVGGDHDGKPFYSALFREDGVWKEDYSQEIQSGVTPDDSSETVAGEGPSKEAFLFVADSICAESTEEGYGILEALVEAGQESDGAVVQKALTALFEGTEEAIGRIRLLDLPLGEETMIRGFLFESEAALAGVRAQIETPEGALELFTGDEGPFADLHEAMHEYGFWQCAGQDPED